MKRWRKRLAVFSLLCAFFLLWNLKTLADEANVPQITLSTSTTEVKTKNKLDVEISVVNENLKQEDFKEDCLWTEGSISNDFRELDPETGKSKKGCLIPGKIVVTIKPGSGQSSNIIDDKIVKLASTEMTSTVGSIEWPTYTSVKDPEYGLAYNNSLISSTGFLVASSKNYRTGLIAYLKMEDGRKYVVNYPVEIKCEDYLDSTSEYDEIVPKLKVYIATQNADTKKYEAGDSLTDIDFMNLTCEQDGNKIVFKNSEYSEAWSNANAFVPTYGYGATGVNSKAISIDEEEQNGYVLDQPIARMESPYTFTVKNMAGTTKSYQVSIEMPWKLSVAEDVAAGTIKEIYVGDEKVTDTTSVEAGSTVKVVYNVENGKKLKGTTFKDNTGDLTLAYTVDGDSITFTMPKDEVILQNPTLETETSEEVPQITLSTSTTEVKTKNKLDVEISVVNENLKQEDFKEDCLWTEGSISNDFRELDPETGKSKKGCLIPGKIVVTIKPGSGQSSNIIDDKIVKLASTEMTSTVGSIEWPTYTSVKDPEYGLAYNNSLISSTGFLVASSKNYRTGLIAYLKMEDGRKYVVNYPVEIKCEDYLDSTSEYDEIVPKLKVYIATQNADTKKYEAGDSLTDIDFMNLTCEQDGNKIVFKNSEYSEAWSNANAFVPTYGYGATGVNSKAISIDEEEQNGYVLDQPIARMESPYTFTVKNMAGTTKSYQVSIEMPWKLSVAEDVAAGTIKEIYVGDEKVTDTTSVEAGSTVKVVYNVENGKKLKGTTFKDNTGDLTLAYTVDGDSITFTMPKDEVILQNPTLETETSEEVPQITLSIDNPDEVLTMPDGIQYKLSVEAGEPLTKNSFSENCVFEDESSEAFVKPGEDGTFTKDCIVPGKIILTVLPNQVSSRIRVDRVAGQENKIHISTSTGTLSNPDGIAAFTSYTPNSFYAECGDRRDGIIMLLKWNNKTYVVNYPVEIKCEDYFNKRQYDSDYELKFSRTTYDSAKGKYIEASKPITTSYIQKFNENVWTVTLENYEKSWAIANTIVPNYAYGVKGTGSVVALISSEDKLVFRSETPLAKLKEPYSFTLTNSMGVEKVFKVEIKMPWPLSKTQSSMVKAIYVDDKLQNNSGIEVEAGKTVKAVYNVPSGKILKSVSFVNKSREPVQVEYKIEGDSVSFAMPKEELYLSTPTYGDSQEETHKVTAEAIVEDGKDSNFADIQTSVEGQILSQASEGQNVVLQASSMKSNYGSLYGLIFDHWESDDIQISEVDSKKQTLEFKMPNKEVSVKGVYVRSGIEITIGTENVVAGLPAIDNFRVGAGESTSKAASKIKVQCRPGETYGISFDDLNLVGYTFLGWKDAEGNLIPETDTSTITWVSWTDNNGNTCKCPNISLKEGDEQMTFIAAFSANTGCVLNYNSSDDKQGSVTASKDGEAIESGNNVLYNGDVISLKAVPKTGYRFAKWKVTNPETGSGIEFASETEAETTFVMPAITSGSVTIQGVFEVDPEYLSPDCDLTKVELLKQDGTLVKQANRSGTTFTIRLSADDMTAEEARNIASGQYLLRLTYPETATAAMEGGMKDGDSGAALWRTGISNSIGIGGSGTFTITAERSEFKNTYTIAIEYDDRPVLKVGTVKRISDTEASVGFRSSSAGTYYWAVVDAGEAKPDIPTNGAGTTFKYADRENTIKLTSLTAGAKDLYIVVKNDDDSTNVKISDVLKISIPAFGGAETTYKVNVTGSLPGGKLTVDKKEAKAGETVTVTVTPDSGKKMTTNSLIYSQSSAPYEVVHIDEKTKQFIMPAYELSVSCRFEDENSSTTPDATTTGKIGAFVVNGVSGTVDNTTGMITVTLPNGTDLTSLAPVITISGAKSISPASGATVDLSSPVTYTLTLEDGTTKTYTVRAYVEGPSKSDQLWNDMLNNVDGSPDHSGSKTWWKKAKDLKKHNDYPEYW